ncbi:MAG: MBOAT family protein [Opitutaceae bacterium]|nr:MBOAT family protein [Opitutaceae bacterium]
MLFNSLTFALFFPAFCALYFLAPRQVRMPLLLAASCGFYMYFIPAYILILFVTIVIDYVAGIYIERVSGPARKAWLVGSIVSTCAVLFVFKYLNFFTENLAAVSHLLGWDIKDPRWNIILPIGLSFHTFQSLSYVIEVYRGHHKAEKDFVIYSTYVMFFPQLVAGPIERPQGLLDQFRVHHAFEWERVASGLRRMAWGFFKKVVIADRLALYVNDVYGAPQNFNGLQLSLATFFFAYQIYCDFSGYSDIAVGSARVLGFRLMENFNTPYYSRSISEFWRRWHISLSSWFRDYLYDPLVEKFRSSAGWAFAILITFGVSGLWHGAAWTYVVWGLLNGVYLLAGGLTEEPRNRVYRALGIADDSVLRTTIRIMATFGLTCVGWVVFRATSMGDVGYILANFWRNWDFGRIGTEQFLLRQMPAAIAGILVLETVQLVHRRVNLSHQLLRLPALPRWAFYLAWAYGMVLFGVFRNEQFIYFQF